MKKRWRTLLLILVAAVSLGVALSYPIRYRVEEKNTEEGIDRLLAMRDAGLGGREGSRYSQTLSEEEADELDAVYEAEEVGETDESGEEGAEQTVPRAESERPGETAPPPLQESAESEVEVANEPEPTGVPDGMEAEPEAPAPTDAAALAPEATDMPEATDAPMAANLAPEVTDVPITANLAPEAMDAPMAANLAPEAADAPITANLALEATNVPEPGETPAPTATLEPTPSPTSTPVPTPTPNRFERDGAVPYDEKTKRVLDYNAILPQFREIYEENHDFVGWINIPGTVVDYPVVQTRQNDYYLRRDFFGNKNANGTIILDSKCDPYTPSYNLVISGHSMRSGKMFGRLVNYMYESYWKKHKLVYFDNLMEENTYVVFAAFFSADYDVDEKGFRYNADIRYSLDARQWLREVEENELYDTGIDVAFGDEFLTLTTCNHAHRSDGRFVVVCRKLREGEVIE